MKKWPTVSKLELSDMYWFNVVGGIQQLKEIGMLEWILSFQNYSSKLRGSKLHTFANTMRNKFVIETLVSQKSSGFIFFFYRTNLTVRITVTELENLNVMRKFLEWHKQNGAIGISIPVLLRNIKLNNYVHVKIPCQ